MRQTRFAHEFVEYIPDQLVEGVLYVSMHYAVASHKCACGCGREVVTPLSPTDWQLRFDGVAISLEPSIGNWNFPCRSHYFIRGGLVRWAGDMSKAAIDHGRAMNKRVKANFYASKEGPPVLSESQHKVVPEEVRQAAHANASARPWWKELGAIFRKKG